LTKPFRDQDLLDAVTRALERDRKRRNDEKDILDLRAIALWPGALFVCGLGRCAPGLWSAISGILILERRLCGARLIQSQRVASVL
jgi:hypothetical protein